MDSAAAAASRARMRNRRAATADAAQAAQAARPARGVATAAGRSPGARPLLSVRGPSAAPAPARRGAQGRGAATRASRGRPATGAASGELGRGPAPAEARHRAAAGPSTNRATGDRAQPGQARPEGPPRRGLGLRRRARAQRQAGRGLSAKRPPQAARPATAPRPARGRARRRGAQPRQGGERGRGRRPRGRYAAGIQDSSCKPPAAWGKLGPLRGASWPVQAGGDPRRGNPVRLLPLICWPPGGRSRPPVGQHGEPPTWCARVESRELERGGGPVAYAARVWPLWSVKSCRGSNRARHRRQGAARNPGHRRGGGGLPPRLSRVKAKAGRLRRALTLSAWGGV